ncbi:MAG TPA: TetR/AcrR family transcriptional regulator [Magnetospirillum sp.]|nr:TetR/AcrR family transcriptional regulator [Magnetospirillum sp.]
MEREFTSLRAINKTELQARIVQCALRLFRENGVAETTMEAIAEAAGVTKRTLYRYFPNKEAVANAYWLGNLRHKTAMLPQLLQLYPDTRGRLMAVFLDAAAGFKAEPVLARLHFSYHFQRVGRQLGENAGLPDDMAAFLAAVIADGQTLGDVRADMPADQLACQLQLVFAGICLMWFADPESFSLEQRLTNAVICFLDGAAGRR